MFQQSIKYWIALSIAIGCHANAQSAFPLKFIAAQTKLISICNKLLSKKQANSSINGIPFDFSEVPAAESITAESLPLYLHSLKSDHLEGPALRLLTRVWQLKLENPAVASEDLMKLVDAKEFLTIIGVFKDNLIAARNYFKNRSSAYRIEIMTKMIAKMSAWIEHNELSYYDLLLASRSYGITAAKAEYEMMKSDQRNGDGFIPLDQKTLAEFPALIPIPTFEALSVGFFLETGETGLAYEGQLNWDGALEADGRTVKNDNAFNAYTVTGHDQAHNQDMYRFYHGDHSAYQDAKALIQPDAISVQLYLREILKITSMNKTFFSWAATYSPQEQDLLLLSYFHLSHGEYLSPEDFLRVFVGFSFQRNTELVAKEILARIQVSSDYGDTLEHWVDQKAVTQKQIETSLKRIANFFLSFPRDQFPYVPVPAPVWLMNAKVKI